MLDKILIPQVYLPIIYIIVAFILNLIIGKIIDKVLYHKQNYLDKKSYNYKKVETYKVLMKNIIKYIIIIFVILAILTVYGIDVTSVLAGLGIVGVVVGLALQDLAKDLISGFTIILENQYAIGDTVTIGDFTGEVIFLGLKSTRIKSYDGRVKIISNRNVTEVINYNLEHTRAIIDIDIAYEEDNEKVEKVLQEAVIELTKSLPHLKSKVELLGIEELSSSSVKYRITAETSGMEYVTLARKIRKYLKETLDKANIKIPYQQIEVHNGK